MPAVQVSVTDVAVDVVASRSVGAVGGIVSIVHVYAAGDGSVRPFAVEVTENVCDPAANPV
ncbi:MAG: hypothetical protein ACYCYA_10950 [Actinomycetes bacterium]